jgi:hypothetical protein
MKYHFISAMLTTGILFLAITVTSAAIIEPLPMPPISINPRAMLSPGAPTQSDSVKLLLILGQYPNSCVPAYTTSFKITQTSSHVCVRAPCPQNYVISLTYAQIPSLLINMVCAQVVSDYGPRFSFGKLAVGNYTVVDSAKNGTAVLSFTVTEQDAYTNPETTSVSGDVAFIVATEKPRYMKGDGIYARYTVKNLSMAKVTFDFSSGCQFDMTAIAPLKDTVYWYQNMRACTMMGTQIVLASGESKSITYPTFSYNDTASVLAVTAKMIGYEKSAATVLVPILTSTAAYPSTQKTTTAKKPVISYSASTKTLSLVLPKSQQVIVSAYVLNGREISQLSTKKFLTAGTHSINLKNASLSNGIIVFRVDGQGFSESKRINLSEGR